MNAPAFGRDVAPPGRKVGATGFARGAPRVEEPVLIPKEKHDEYTGKIFVCDEF
jgi:hypothetical protein